MQLSEKGQKLIELYAQMASGGYIRKDGEHVPEAYNDFELRPYRAQLKTLMTQFHVETALDYGSGGSDWQAAGFDPESGQSAMDYFGLKQLFRYEPARGVDERQQADAVINFDVLEHIFIADVPSVIRDLFRHCRKLLIVNVACYQAAAQLPNGENAHITVRPPLWWKGMFDSIAPEFPDVSVILICSEGWRKSMAFDLFSAGKWHADDKFVIVN